jgi:hypothetical protein
MGAREKKNQTFLDSLPEPSVYFARYSQDESQELFLVQFLPHDASFPRKVLKQYDAYGFALIDSGHESINEKGLVRLAEILKLGKPFVPAHYAGTENIYDSYGFNTITSKRPDVTPITQRAFYSTLNQELHVDGTLQSLGEIPTSLLACKKPAIEGGETIIFNAVGAFVYIVEQRPELATPLLDERCLIRTNVNRSEMSSSGPAFGFKGKQLLSRFSIDNTSKWQFEDVPLLREAFEWLVKLAQPGSPFYTEFRLQSGEILLIANDRISHGRRAFRDKFRARRTMIRGLFLKRPQF